MSNFPTIAEAASKVDAFLCAACGTSYAADLDNEDPRCVDCGSNDRVWLRGEELVQEADAEGLPRADRETEVAWFKVGLPRCSPIDFSRRVSLAEALRHPRLLDHEKETLREAVANFPKSKDVRSGPVALGFAAPVYVTVYRDGTIGGLDRK